MPIPLRLTALSVYLDLNRPCPSSRPFSLIVPQSSIKPPLSYLCWPIPPPNKDLDAQMQCVGQPLRWFTSQNVFLCSQGHAECGPFFFFKDAFSNPISSDEEGSGAAVWIEVHYTAWHGVFPEGLVPIPGRMDRPPSHLSAFLIS